MLFSIKKRAIRGNLSRQLKNFFVPCDVQEEQALDTVFDSALQRVELCFSHIVLDYYGDEEPYFNPYHTGQYCIFLYYISNLLYKQFPGLPLLADKVYALNKALHAVDLFYAVSLPDIFFCDHPVGTVLGRAVYSNYFSFAQGCTIGNNNGKYPQLGSNVALCAGAMIVGDCKVGDNVTIGAGACVKDTDIPSDTTVFGSSPNLVLKSKRRSLYPFRLQTLSIRS